MFQFLPGGATVYGVAFLVLFAGILGLLGAWVYYDASSRGIERPGRWAVAVAVFAPLLLAYVRRRGERVRPPTKGERLTLPALLAVLFAWITGTLLAPPDPGAQLEYVLGVLVLALPAAYMFVSPGGGEDSGAAGQ